ncbi:MAG: hypothetical protein GY810_14035 [Aureispira sp.]|nr:hypothetical protein [Aureispira sp.]
MAFKSKIKPNEVKDMDFKTYTATLKKEVAKAAKFGETSVVAFSNYKFACGHEGTLLLLGKYSGPLAKFYKESKLKRKKENDFAKGTCYFETDDKGSVQMSIALNDGKGKPDKLRKNGKALFKKLGMTPHIIKGELPTVDEDTQLSQEEVEHIENSADQQNDDQSLAKVAKQYEQAYKKMANHVIPLIQLKDKAVYNSKHFEVAKMAFKASASFLNKYQEAKEKAQEKFSGIHKTVQNRHKQIQKIVAKVKLELSKKAQVHGSTNDVEQVLEDVQSTIKDMRQKFQKAFNLIEKIKLAKN